MAFVLCFKPTRLISKTGHAAILTATRQPQVIADQLIPDALLAGCVKCNERGQVLVNDLPIDVVETLPPTPEEAKPGELPVRERLVVDAVKGIIEQADATEITASGIPRVFAVSTRCGFKVSQSDVQQALTTLGY